MTHAVLIYLAIGTAFYALVLAFFADHVAKEARNGAAFMVILAAVLVLGWPKFLPGMINHGARHGL